MNTLSTWLVALSVVWSTAANAQFAPDVSFRPDGLEASAIAGTSCTGFWRTPSFQCKAIQIPAYFARAKDGTRAALVLISGNAGGLDRRHGDYARFLAEHGINAVVLDSFVARGRNGGTGSDLNAGRGQGLDAVNLAIDAITAASVLASQSEWANAKIGYFGESMGGAASINVGRPYIEAIVHEQNPNIRTRTFDAAAGLYAACLDRNTIERFKKIPLLLVMPEKDDVTPPANCQRQAEWMNGRGGDVSVVVLPGEYHDYDGPWPLKNLNGMNTSKCSALRDGDKFTLEASGKEFPGTPQGYNDMISSCATRGFMTGHRGKDRLGYDIWLGHFQKTLLGVK
jgi:dienelactone hydrolase